MTRTMLARVGTLPAPFAKVFRLGCRDWQFAIEERAAILEYDEGLLTRATAGDSAADQIAAQRRGCRHVREADAGYERARRTGGNRKLSRKPADRPLDAGQSGTRP